MIVPILPTRDLRLVNYGFSGAMSALGFSSNRIISKSAMAVYGYTLSDTAGGSNVIENNTAPDATVAEIRQPSTTLTGGNSFKAQTFMEGYSGANRFFALF